MINLDDFEDKIIDGVYGDYNCNILKNFKVKDLKFYSDTEYIQEGRKYRNIFYGPHVSYIYSDFEIYNLMFNVKDWEINIKYKIYNVINNLITDYSLTRKVKKGDNVATIGWGWGNVNKGIFWKKNEYWWEVWVCGKKIIEKKFYVDDYGEVTKDNNPYFEISTLRLYERGSDFLDFGIRKYLKVFKVKNTRYLNLELSAKNKIRDSRWNCEIIYSIRNELGEIKCKRSELKIVYPGDEIISFDLGWGTTHGDYYGKGKYFFELVFMETLIAQIPFAVDDTEEESNEYEHCNPFPKYDLSLNVKSRDKFDNFSGNINELVALESLKKDLKEYYDYMKFCSIRSKYQIKVNHKPVLHSVFTGNPGTGKTTVAKLLGKIYKKLGLLTQGHVHEVSRSELIGEYIGHTAGKVNKAIDKARGGILFIDEAYSLARVAGDKRDFGSEAIEVLIKEMSDGQGNIAIIAAGYPEEMQIFLDSNPGLRSRFNKHFNFPDYTPDELWDILNYSAKKRQLIIADDVKKYLYPVIVELYRNRNNAFGNARLINQILDKADINLGIRYLQNESAKAESDVCTLIDDDFKLIFDKSITKNYHVPVDESLLLECGKELNNLIGLEEIKSEILNTVKLVKYFKKNKKNHLKSLCFNYLFIGNPGTGKTTVARIMAGVLKSLGILDRGHLIECDRRKLVGRYVGETAIKTGNLINKAKGGVLFIDEAYSLSEGGEADFGREAIEVLLKEMEDNRGEFALICAGYPDKMNNFINSNPGFKSRFEKIFHFEDYSTEELIEIAACMLSDKGLKITGKAEKYLQELIIKSFNTGNKYFGNAREIRKFINLLIAKHYLWVADLNNKNISVESENVIDFQSMIDFNLDEKML